MALNLKLASSFLKSYLDKLSDDDLNILIKGLDKDNIDRLTLLLCSLPDTSEPVFSMSKYLKEFKEDFDQTYSSLDMDLVLEYLRETEGHEDFQLREINMYLKYWFEKQTKTGGLFNFF